jgi:hypothetical protein
MSILSLKYIMYNTITYQEIQHPITYDRYPTRIDCASQFFSSQWVDSIVNDCMNKRDDRCQHVIEHRDGIIDMLNNDNYDEYEKMWYLLEGTKNNELLCDDFGPYDDKELFDNDFPAPNEELFKPENQFIHSISDTSRINFGNGKMNIGRNYYKVLVMDSLSHYCVIKCDDELLKLIILKNKHHILAYTTFPQLIIDIVRENKTSIFRVIIENANLDDDTINYIFADIMSFSKSPLIFIEILMEYGHRMNSAAIALAIMHNNIDLVQFAITNNYNVQEAFDVYLCKEKVPTPKCSAQMLKLLLDNNIDISKNLNDIFYCNIMIKDLESVIFLLETFPQCDINYGLNVCCMNNYSDILLYLLTNGADINKITKESVLNTKIDIIKILILYEYPITTSALNIHLFKCFVYDDKLDNIYYLVENGGNPSCLIYYDKRQQNIASDNNTKMSRLHSLKWEILPSPLEYMITVGKITHIKFLAENCLNILCSELNRLAVLAAANGQCDILVYLLDLGAELDIKALISACFFGHLRMIELLLSYGMEFSSIEENLFTITINGELLKGTPSIEYTNLIKDNNIFKNDIYNYGRDYVEIFRLFIKHGIPKPNYPILEILPKQFYELDIFTYFIGDDIDINKVLNSTKRGEPENLLELSIIYQKIEITELLLEYGTNPVVRNKSVIQKVKENKEIHNLLLKYGVMI